MARREPAKRNFSTAWQAPSGGQWPVVVCLAAVLALLWAAPARAASVYVISNLSVEAEAKDAVQAKKKALEAAERRAMAILLRRLAPFGAYERLPSPKISIIEELIEGFSVQRESNSATRYLATLDFTFQRNAVRQFLSGYGIPYAEGQAPKVMLLPVFVNNGKIARSTANPWRKAWRGLDLVNTVTPVKLAAVGGAVTDTVIAGLQAGDDSAFEALTAAYKSDRFVVALASYDETTGKLTTRYYGVDAAGAVKLVRDDRVWDGDVKASANHAAMVGLGILEGRWKAVKAPSGEIGSNGADTAFGMTVEFAGLQQWQQMRARLTRVPGVQALKITSLSARSADVSLQYPGGAERLSRQLGAYNLFLENAGEAWILRGE
jgi:hypothetical protein